tara:strand:- start:2688 stop:3998 length:1311 start_codon:yes stop_codon:yes gene_type:complete
MIRTITFIQLAINFATRSHLQSKASKAIKPYSEAILSLLLMLSTTGASAVQSNDWTKQIQSHGFATQGLIFTTDNNFYGDSDHGSANFTELGINASAQLSPRVRLAGQLLSRHAGNMDNGSPRVDYALLDISLLSSSQRNLGLYLGRVKSPLGLYNETRDIGHTRASVFTQQVIYFDKVRDLTMSADGIHFYGEYFLTSGTLLIQAGIGYPIPDDNAEYTFLGDNWAGHLEANQLASVGRIMYEHDGGRWILALSGASLELDFKAGATDPISSGKLEIDYTILSAQFNGEKWQLTAEGAIQKSNFIGLGGVFSDADIKPQGLTLEAKYRFSSKWQAFIRSETFYLDREDKYGHLAAEKLQLISNTSYGGLLPIDPSYNRYSKAWIVGGRWDINNNLMVAADYHIIKGGAILSAQDNDINTTKKYWDMFAVSISYRF